MGDESQARHMLADMQARLARSAYDALEIPAGDVTPEQVRAAFHQLAKQFHPAKFARMSQEIQKLANEVFLALRAAHDLLSRPKVRQPTPQVPFLAAKTPPDQNRAGSSANNIPASRGRPNSPPPPSSAIAPPTQRGPGVSAQNIPVVRTASSVATPARPGVQQPVSARRATPAGGVPITTASGPRPAVGLAGRSTTPGGGVAARTPMPGGRSPTPAGGIPVRPPTPAKASVEPELVGVFADLERRAWGNARAALNALLAMRPEFPRYQALLHYTNGREALDKNEMGDARVELAMAANLDQSLKGIVATALEEYRRRK